MSIGDLARRRHVVGDRDGRGAEALHAVDDQIVDDVGHDRIETGGRLVEEDDLRIGRDGARQADALLHAARKLGRIELADFRSQAQPGRASRSAIVARLGSRAILRPWISPKATFCQTGSESNSAAPWNSMPKRERNCVALACR